VGFIRHSCVQSPNPLIFCCLETSLCCGSGSSRSRLIARRSAPSWCPTGVSQCSGHLKGLLGCQLLSVCQVVLRRRGKQAGGQSAGCISHVQPRRHKTMIEQARRVTWLRSANRWFNADSELARRGWPSPARDIASLRPARTCTAGCRHSCRLARDFFLTLSCSFIRNWMKYSSNKQLLKPSCYSNKCKKLKSLKQCLTATRPTSHN